MYLIPVLLYTHFFTDSVFIIIIPISFCIRTEQICTNCNTIVIQTLCTVFVLLLYHMCRLLQDNYKTFCNHKLLKGQGYCKLRFIFLLKRQSHDLLGQLHGNPWP